MYLYTVSNTASSLQLCSRQLLSAADPFNDLPNNIDQTACLAEHTQSTQLNLFPPSLALRLLMDLQTCTASIEALLPQHSLTIKLPAHNPAPSPLNKAADKIQPAICPLRCSCCRRRRRCCPSAKPPVRLLLPCEHNAPLVILQKQA